MFRIQTLTAVAILFLGHVGSTLAQGDAKAIVDKLIKAQGGEEKLAKIKTITWKSKGKISFGGNENELSTVSAIQGIDRYRSDFEGAFGKGFFAIEGDKGSSSFGGELAGDMLANQKRELYLQLIPMNTYTLKDSKSFKVEAGGEGKIGDKPADVLKITGPDGKSAMLFADKESGLVKKMTAKMVGFDGQEVEREWQFSDHKVMGGITIATKTVVSNAGEKFLENNLQEFQAMDKIDDTLFPK